MSLRLLLGTLGWLWEQQNASEYVDETDKAQGEYYAINGDFQTPAKFHIGMLTISLLVGLGYGGYTAYSCWVEKDILLGYIRNLVIALVCRTFFSILFDGVILLGSPSDVGGGNTLLSFEQIFLDVVLALWLSLTVYMHARVQRNFKSEPTIRLYQYGIPAVAVFFSFIWIFTLQDQLPSIPWWIILQPLTQWIVNSLNLLFVLIQLGLVIDMGRMIMTKTSLDNDSTSLLRKSAAMIGILVFTFWLQFGLSLGRRPFRNTEGYLYFYYLIDGLECTIVCACLFFFYKWVQTPMKKLQSIMDGIETPLECTRGSYTEVLMPPNEGIFTVDRAFKTGERGTWKHSEEDGGTKDVVYSNVVEPERLQKTLELYKRLNVIPRQEVTVVEGENFYDCQISTSTESHKLSQQNLILKQKASSAFEEIKFKNDKITEQIQKKNAFYSSKYLILDEKEGGFPKYLETRPSITSVSEKGSPKEESRLDFPPDSKLEPIEMVHQWLNDCSEDMQIYDEPRKRASIGQEQQEEASSKISQLNGSKDKIQSDTNEETGTPVQHRHSPSEHVFADKEKITTVVTRNFREYPKDIKNVKNVSKDKFQSDTIEESGPPAQHRDSPSEQIFRQSGIATEESDKPQIMNKNEEFEHTEGGLSQALSNLNLKSEQKQYKANSDILVEDVDTTDIPTKASSQIITLSELENFRSKQNQSAKDRDPITKNSFRLHESILTGINSLISTGFHGLMDFFPAEKETRPSISSASEKGSPKEESGLNFPPDSKVESAEIVRKQLNDYSEDKQIYDETRKRASIGQEQQEGASTKISQLNVSEDKFQSDAVEETGTPVRQRDSPSEHVSLDKERNITAVAEENVSKDKFQSENEKITKKSGEIIQDRFCESIPRQPKDGSKPESTEKLKEDFPGGEQTAKYITPTLPDKHLEESPMGSKTPSNKLKKLKKEKKRKTKKAKLKIDQILSEYNLETSSDLELQMSSKKWLLGRKRKNQEETQGYFNFKYRKAELKTKYTHKESFEGSNRLTDKSEESQPKKLCNVPDFVKPSPKSQSATSASGENKMELHETEIVPSDSEFNIERHSSGSKFSIESQSSVQSFSLERYYRQLQTTNAKFNNQQNFY